jgi:hypothetical protein
VVTILIRTAIVLLILGYASSALAQIAPVSPDRAWHAMESNIDSDAKQFREPRFSVDPNRMYSLSP